jgi:hypothetical protein
VLGALQAYAGLSATRAGDQTEALRLLRLASRAADDLGRDCVAHGVFFGRAYLAILEAGVWADVGQPQRAVRLGETVRMNELASVNRAGYHAVYLARAHTMCGDDDRALTTITSGLQIAPEVVCDQAIAGRVARDVVCGILRRRRRADERLRRVARALNVAF